MYFFIHVDCDPDNLSACRIRPSNQRSSSSSKMKWNGLQATMKHLRNLKENLENSGLVFESTFFLRADRQIKGIYGTYSEVFLKFYDCVGQFSEAGWHPHLYRWLDSRQCWAQESSDEEWMSETLVECHEDLKAHGISVSFCKMGWSFHNDTTMNVLSNQGILADFSAIPGARSPGRVIEGVSLQDIYDWRKTKPFPYHPSEYDYQTSGNLRILEIPLTTYSISGIRIFLYTSKLTFESMLRLDFSFRPTFKIAAPLFLPNLNLKNISDIGEFILRSQAKYATIYFHPENPSENSSLGILESFLSRLIAAGDKLGSKITFVNASQLFKLCNTF